MGEYTKHIWPNFTSDSMAAAQPPSSGPRTSARFTAKLDKLRRANKRYDKLFSEAYRTLEIIHFAERTGRPRLATRKREYYNEVRECLHVFNAAGKHREYRDRARKIFSEMKARRERRKKTDRPKVKDFQQLWDKIKANHQGSRAELQQIYREMRHQFGLGSISSMRSL